MTKCEMNDEPKPVIDKKSNTIMTCKDFRKIYNKCVYESEQECDVPFIGKNGRILIVPYSEYLKMLNWVSPSP